MTRDTNPEVSTPGIPWEHKAELDSINDVAKVVCLALATVPRFCLWLCGPVGAGKTTLARAMLHEMGLPRKVPVLSPTYTYIQEYLLPDGRRMAHMDLYRGTAIDALEDAGIFADLDQFAGLIIEWPPAGDTPVHARNHGYQPTHTLAITPIEDGGRRHYQLSVAR